MIENSIRDLVIKTGTKQAIHIECEDSVSDVILNTLEHQHASVGFVYRDDTLYDKLSVKDYLSLFAAITKQKSKMAEAIQAMHLSDCLNTVIGKLSYGHKRRIAIAREIIKDHELIYIQEPLLNLDEDSTHYILRWLEEYLPADQQLMTSSISLKSLFLMEGRHYYADEYGVQLISSNSQSGNNEPEEHEQITEISIEDLIDHKINEMKEKLKTNAEEPIDIEIDETEQVVNKVKLVDKISAHFEDKVLLFNPNDIDYMESINGKVHINIRGNSFPANYTMEELEKKLERYGFFRCHRSYLVNMQKVQEIVRWTRNSYSLRLEEHSDANIPLSKGRVDELKKNYNF